MQIQDVFAAYKEDLKKVEETLNKEIISEVELIPEIAHHLIDSGGKRFRPLLVLISAGLCDYSGDHRFPIAAVMEFIHTATLFHDDVIDQATIRRGRTSANNVWGNAATVLIGDFLYSKSFTLMTSVGNMDIMKLMSKTSNIMSEGEVFQLMKCGDVNLTEEEYLTIIKKKTAFLISASCAAGAILASVPQEKIDALAQIGFNIGMAFQMTDDTLDYMAQEQEFGKSIGKDLEEGKITLPLIYALRNATKEERDKTKDLIARKENNAEIIQTVLGLIQKYKGIDYSLQCAGNYIKNAQAQLKIFGECAETNHLNTVAEYVLARRL